MSDMRAIRSGYFTVSAVPCAFVIGVTGGLRLQRGVLDVEVTGQALVQPVQHLTEGAVHRGATLHHNVGGHDRKP